LSQSRTAKHRYDTSDGPGKMDLLYAVVLHILVFSVVMVVGYWQSTPKHEPLKRIEVMMISAKELSRLEQQARRKPKPAKQVKAKQKPKPKVKPKPVIKPKAKAKPVARPVVKAAPKPRQQAKTTAKVDPDYDPFAPVTSTTDRSESTKKASTSRPEMANLAGKQLSKNERERYIALMQTRIHEHWKVPVSTNNFKDPVVEMNLAPNGEVVSVHILDSSGNEQLDASLVRAIHAASPFEVPHQQFEYFRSNRISFRPLR